MKTKSKKKIILLSILLVIGQITLLIFSRPYIFLKIFAINDVYYVSQTGDDNNDGSLASPWATIQKAADTLSPGDTVKIFGGTYDAYVNMDRSGQEGSPITFESYDSTPVIITGSTNWAAFNIDQANWIVIKNLTFHRTSSASNEYWNIFIQNGSHNTIEGNDISGGDSGIHVMSGSANSAVYVGTSIGNVINNNTIHDLDTKVYGEGIYIKTYMLSDATIPTTRDTIITNNNVSGSSEAVQNTVATWVNGVMVDNYDGDLAPSGTLIQNNNLHNNACDAGVVQLKGDNIVFENNYIHDNESATKHCSLEIENGDNYLVRNNLFVNNIGITSGRAAIFTFAISGTVANNTIIGDNSGVSFGTAVGNLSIKNNIINGVSGLPIYESDPNPLVSVSYNIIDKDTGYTGSNYTVNTTPGFVNAAGGDYHLNAGVAACTGGEGGTYQGAFACPVDPTPTSTLTPTPAINIYYVSTTGDDNNVGSESSPWRNINKCNVAGYSCVITAGTYDEAINIVGNGITMTAQGVVNMKGFDVEGNNNIVKGFKIENPESNSGLRVSGNYNLFEDNDVSNTLQDGVWFFGHDNIFRNNNIHDIWLGVGVDPDPHVDCFQTWSWNWDTYNVLFEGNTCNHTRASGSNQIAIMSADGPTILRDITFRNNVFIMHDSGYSPMLVGTAVSGNITGINIIHNTFYNTTGAGGDAVYFDKVNDSYAYNNISIGYSQFVTDSSGLNNHIAFNMASGDYGMVDYLNYNFHLLSSSVACTGGEAGSYQGAFPCDSSPTETPTPTPTLIVTITETPIIVTATVTNTPIATLVATNTPITTPTNTAIPTNTIAPTNTITPTNTIAPTAVMPTPTRTTAPTAIRPTSTRAPLSNRTSTPVPSATFTPTITQTYTPIISPTDFVTPTLANYYPTTVPTNIISSDGKYKISSTETDGGIYYNILKVKFMRTNGDVITALTTYIDGQKLTKTDSEGISTFQNVREGEHIVTYEYNNKESRKTINIPRVIGESVDMKIITVNVDDDNSWMIPVGIVVGVLIIILILILLFRRRNIEE